MQLINTSHNILVASDVEVADSILSRLKGLLGRTELPSGRALIITQCRSIHMFFMKFAIDVLFVDKNNKVVGVVKNIRPFQMSPYFIRASYAVELPSGTIEKTGTKKGDLLQKTTA